MPFEKYAGAFAASGHADALLNVMTLQKLQKQNEENEEQDNVASEAISGVTDSSRSQPAIR